MHKNLIIDTKDNSLFYDYSFELAPFSRVAFLATESFFLTNGKKVIQELKKRKLKVTSVVFSSNTVFSTQTLCGLFNFPEDVRLVVALEKSVYPACFYFSSLRNVPSLVLADTESLDFALQTSFLVTTGIYYDCFKFSDQRHVVLIENEKNYCERYASIVAKRLSLIDYKVKCLINNKPYCKKYYSCIEYLKDFNFKSPTLKDLHQIDKELSLENYFCGGELFNEGIIYPLRVMFFKKSSECLFFAKHFYNTFDEWLTKDGHYLTDYNLRADILSKFLKLDSDALRRNVKKQLKNIKENILLFNTAKRLLTDALTEVNDFLDMAVKVYFELGGKAMKLEKSTEVLGFLACDLLKNINSATLFREYICN